MVTYLFEGAFWRPNSSANMLDLVWMTWTAWVMERTRRMTERMEVEIMKAGV